MKEKQLQPPVFQPPEFLQGQSFDEILGRMMDMLPDTLDKSEGQFPWDFMAPTAAEKAETAEFLLPEAIKAAFPMWARGYLLDYHAQTRGITRRAARSAVGAVTVEGTPGTKIPAGFLFSTAADYDKAGVVFTVDEETVLLEGSAEVAVTAVERGSSGNVAANSIALMVSPLAGVKAVANREPATGGTEEESDEALRARILDYDRNQGESFIGSAADYRRWALEVPGTGGVTVIPAQDDSGLVKIVLMNAQGGPADEALCKMVEEHIMGGDDPYQRLAPVNARIRVTPPEVVTVRVQAAVETREEADMNGIAADLAELLKAYYAEADGEIVYTRIGAVLSGCAGVLDYRNLLVNGGVENITLTAGQIAITETENITILGKVQ